MKYKIQNLAKLHEELFPELEVELRSAINSCSFIGGSEIELFEKEFSEKHHFKYTVACGNGTDAIYIAIRSLDLPSNSEILVPSLTWISSSEVITQAGHKPVFCDIQSDGFNISIESIKKNITPKTKAIVLVHLYGIPADLNEIVDICKSHDIKIIEDCAQAHFAKYDNEYVGTFGDVATFSFYPGKNLGAFGDAGCLSTNSTEIFNFSRMFARHGALIKHQHQIEGINSRLDTLQAIVLRAKLKKIDIWTNKRISVAKLYDEMITSPKIKKPNFENSKVSTWHQYTIRCKERDRLQKYLHEHGIETSINYPSPLPLLECYAHLNPKKEDYQHAIKATNELLCIPMCPTLNESDVSQISNVINTF